MSVAYDKDRAGLRRRMRESRRALPESQRHAASRAVAETLARLGLPRPGTRVGAYIPMDCELDPAPAVRLALARRCEVFAPTITSFSRRSMRFAPLRADRPSRRNRWGIREPDATWSVNGRWLDLVLVPCVAFDESGARLGMGAGFYDRHFSFLPHRSSWRRPRLLGIAYESQRVAELQQKSWDVPLWGVITERGVYAHAAGMLHGEPNEETT